MERFLIFSALAIGGYMVYRRGQERIAECCPPGLTQAVCLMAVDPGFFNTMRVGLQSGPIANIACTVQQTLSKEL